MITVDSKVINSLNRKHLNINHIVYLFINWLWYYYIACKVGDLDSFTTFLVVCVE